MPVPKKYKKPTSGRGAQKSKGSSGPTDSKLGSSTTGSGSPGRKKELSAAQRVFINSLVETGNKEQAAMNAGVPEDHAKGRAAHWLKDPLVMAEYQRRVQQQNSRADFKADELLRQLQIGAFLDYRGWFEPDIAHTGGWLISEQNYMQLPTDIARLIETAERVMEYNDEGIPVNTGMYRIYLIDRKTMIQLVARSMLGDKVKVEGNVTQINWHELVLNNQLNPNRITDVVEERVNGLRELMNRPTERAPILDGIQPAMPKPIPADQRPIIILPSKDDEPLLEESSETATAGEQTIRLVPDAIDQLNAEAERIARGE